MLLKPPPGGSTNRPLIPSDSRAKSMEFLLDKENQAAAQPPENELQKGGAGERVMSEHQLRVQRSLQKLNVPDWYKNSNVARGPEGFLLKRNSDAGHGWPGLGSKTTSLSSLGSTQSAAARSPTRYLDILFALQPPENELQKGGAGERVMSEHQLRVQRSLQKLNVPDWYKNSNVARGPEGFLLKRNSDAGHGWPGLGSKTTSLSSLGSTQSAAARSPTSHLLSPSPTPHVFTRWSTSRLNSGGTSASTSPCGSTRSSFNYRQPYLGWRSQERLARPRTPAERLAVGLLPAQQQQHQIASPQNIITPQQELQQILQQEVELEQLQREDEEQVLKKFVWWNVTISCDMDVFLVTLQAARFGRKSSKKNIHVEYICHLLSPSPTPHVFTRWSTSRLNSGGTSASTSPCGSTRSSFNYRQPYLGWRSQERLARPRTPAERLAVGLLPAQQQQHQIASPQNIITPQQELQQILQQEVELEQLQREDEEQCSSYSVTMEESTICDLPSQVRCILIAMGKLYSVLFSIAFFFKFHYLHVIFYITESAAGVNVYLYVYAYNWKYRWMQQVPNLSEVRTSIKEVTSAIVHYVSGVRDGSGEALAGDSQWDSLSPPRGADWDIASTPRGSPRGSSGRLCWLESSFVGTRPLDSPETPLTLTSADVNKTLETLQQQQQQQQHQQQQQQQDGGINVIRKLSGTTGTGPPDLYLDLSSSQRVQNFNTHHHHQVNGPDDDHEMQAELRNKPSPGSTTLEDVLDSLLGLPPTSRSPSPGAGSASPGHCRPLQSLRLHQHHNQRRSCGDLHSDLAGSASGGLPAAPDPPPYYVSDTLRRRSEGSGRRVSFDMTTSCGGGQHQQPIESVVRCRYSKCGRTASIAEARMTFKTCHNCSHVYCSRECRRSHWERHRKTCLHSRVGALCHQVLTTVREDPVTLRHLSVLARRGYLAQGRGAVKSFFSSPELAERFVANGFVDLGEPAFVGWADLLPGEMGADLYSELLRLCKSYNPDTRFVLYVAVCVVSEVPTSGAVKWERQLVSRCTKLRLCRSLTSTAPPQATSGPQSYASPCNITRDSENPETLILTSLPGCQGQMAPQRAREISFINIQRHLRQRGVSLRRHFPDVYKRLCAYVDGSTERFTPVTVYPRDVLTGKSFMCVIMPDAEPEKLELVPRDSSRVQTIDISLEHEAT
ncbi:uncharacterized protein LOC110836754 [Zootermopsis nevadensis]|uniref:uncharacterized protein LOC110836754 n=1 Tax=Zootermopsis nevadensis TaxID=136037 RepID=UPI000B8EB306|nr:uncharacterized protein LOC110836754 [Zootermopsis nevadensis]